jgi:hypothetical protein
MSLMTDSPGAIGLALENASSVLEAALVVEYERVA